jgi:3-isopropylmalate/(R)-2-methylmalate dehydratase large subunit
VGICHVVVPQGGHIRPGMFCVGGDSHSPTGGAFGAYMFGIGSTEMLGVVVTGEIWVRVPHTIRMQWDRRLPAGVMAKDMMLHMIGRFGMNGGNYQAVEFCGEAVRALSIFERMTLSNMSAELGSQVGLIAPDRTTRDWLASVGAHDVDMEGWYTDDGAEATTHRFDAECTVPAGGRPPQPCQHSRCGPLQRRGDRRRLTSVPAPVPSWRICAPLPQCSPASASPAGVRLMVAPASVQDQQQAEREGVMETLRAAGAEVLPTACGACAGYGGSIPDGANVIATTARNFKGRMGSATTQVYLASPYTVAASAVSGRISDPREMLA